jgi:hypothetical protein
VAFRAVLKDKDGDAPFRLRAAQKTATLAERHRGPSPDAVGYAPALLAPNGEWPVAQRCYVIAGSPRPNGERGQGVRGERRCPSPGCRPPIRLVGEADDDHPGRNLGAGVKARRILIGDVSLRASSADGGHSASFLAAVEPSP